MLFRVEADLDIVHIRVLQVLFRFRITLHDDLIAVNDHFHLPKFYRARIGVE